MTPALTRRQLGLLGVVTSVGSLGTHMVVPALPLMAQGLRVEPATIALTISVYLFGIGAGQIAWGPISDARGRRPVLLAGGAIFAAGSLAGSVATSIAVLLGARLVQAIGAAATLVASRALVAERPTATADLAMLSTITLLSPAAAPTLGGLLVVMCGWRGIFVLLAAIALLAMSGLMRLPRGPGPAVAGGGIVMSYRRLANNREFRLLLLAGSMTSAGSFMFLGASPLLLAGHYGLTPPETGLCLFVVAVAIIAGTLGVRWLGQAREHLVVPMAGAAMLCGAAGLGATALWPGTQALRPIAAMAMVAFGSGLATPAILSRALRAEPGVAGTASSIIGAVQMTVSSALSALLLQATDDVRIVLAAISGTVMIAAATLSSMRRSGSERRA